MSQFILNIGFLYFPEDKSSYLPAAFELLLLIVLTAVAFMWVRRIAKKQELKTKDLEERILRERQQNIENQK